MKKIIVAFGFFLLLFFSFGCLSFLTESPPTHQDKIKEDNKSSPNLGNNIDKKVFSITYVDPNSGVIKRILAIQKNENEYATEDGETISASVIKDKNSLSLVDSTICCPCQDKDYCVEPEPEVLYLCADQKVTTNINDCDISCNQKAEKLVYVCGDGKEVTDPYLCGGIIGVKFICEDGKEVYSAAECGCTSENTVATHACQPKIEKTLYVCSDNSVATKKELCGFGVVDKYFVCTDGRHVKMESDCSAICQGFGTVTAAIPSNIKLIYKCWNGLIVNNKWECPSYCNKGCICPEYYSPVCGNGRTYPNECFAKCAGVTTYTKGPCDSYVCLNNGMKCDPPTLTHLDPKKEAAVCCPGLVCAPAATKTATHLSNEYVCQSPEKEEKPPLACSKEGETCTTYITAAGKSSTCCEGLSCGSNGVCMNISKQWCKDSDNGKNQAVFGMVSWGTGDTSVSMEYDTCYEYDNVIEWYCYENAGRSTVIKCKSGQICLNGACVNKGQECKYEYCQNGIFYTSCYFDSSTGACRCPTAIKCDSGRCNSEGTGCGPVEQIECQYEYCKDGVFYTSCSLTAAANKCECATTIPCQKGVCNAAGTGCG